ncbi:MAG: oxidase [Fimbriimonadales bacterium]|nr:MAG: oxidase [Fimbriimonadales bacterium]
MSFEPAKPQTYLLTFAALIVLTIITVLAARVVLPKIPMGIMVLDLNIVLAMAIACVKASLVVLYFMHFKDMGQVSKVWAAAGVFFLLVMFFLTLGDYENRHPEETKGWTESGVLHDRRP